MKHKYAILSFILVILIQPAFAQTAKELNSLTTTLEKVFDLDQGVRHTLSAVEEKYGHVSPEYKQALEDVDKQDKTDQQIVFTTFDKYGWLRKKQTSEKASKALFYVLQHAHLEDQIKYRTLITKAFKAGEANAEEYAIFNDRINIRQGKFQVYGSQANNFGQEGPHIYPITDEPNLDKRREKVGLNPMNEYVKQLGIDNYKKPQRDTLKGKVVLIGHIFDPAQKGIADAEVYLKDQLIGKTNEKGFFSIPVKKNKDEKLTISITKEGRKPITRNFTGDKDFFETYIQFANTQ